MKRESLWALKNNLNRCLMIYVIASLAYMAVSVYSSWRDTIAEVDRQLELAALALPGMVAPDFHDRATDGDSISLEEELKNREIFGDYVRRTGFAWIYTLVEQDGRFFFAAPNVSDQEAAEQLRWYYYPYPEIPHQFIEAYSTGKPVWASYSDRWGSFRSVAYPLRSRGGRPFLACADYEVSFVKGVIIKQAFFSGLVSALFLLVALPFFLAYRKHAETMDILVRDLERYSNDLESMVRDRTQGLNNALAELEDLANRDYLTGIYNRRYGMETLKKMTDPDEGYRGWLLLVDLDDFKGINDTLGHQAGDDLLRQVGATLSDLVGEDDIPVRYGGDEFIVICPDAKDGDIDRKVDDIKKAISDLGDRRGCPLSVSVGATRIVPGIPVKFLIDEADRCLYSDKKQGQSL